MIRVLLVDDHAFLRMGVKSFLDLVEDIEVVGESESGEDAVRDVARLKPDVVIMDLMMPGIGGVEAIGRMMQADRPPRVLVLSSFGQSAEMARALSAGALGALSKDAPMEELVKAIRRVHSGKKYIPRDIANYLSANPLLSFTDREKQIMRAISKGLTNEDIAAMLDLSVPRVKQHLKDLFARLGVANRTEAATCILQERLV